VALGRLLLVTDRRLAERGGRRLEDVVADALAARPWGAMVVQLREKELAADQLVALGRRVVAACRVHGAPMLVNAGGAGREVARAIGADGVHLPDDAGAPIAAARAALPAGALIGRSTHDVAAVARAANDGADLIVFGPIWETPSKRALGEPLGLGALAGAVAAAAAAPLYAIGGIETAERAAAVRDTGAYGVAAIRAVMAAEAPGEVARALTSAILGGCEAS
jgi:thiamine-phosphate pyrophosphorylase